MIRARKLGKFATAQTPDSGANKVTLTDDNGGLVEYSREQIKTLRQELARASRTFKIVVTLRWKPAAIRLDWIVGWPGA